MANKTQAEQPQMQVEYWDIEKLIPYARNPRKNDDAVPKMAGLIREFGFKVPVVIRSTGDVIDGILSEVKKEADKVIINSAELEKYFGKDKSPREMKNQIIALLDDWKAKQPPELAKPQKKTEKAL